ncbi:hypothetical protein [Aureispira sp. CCB-QB1]|uniref:hypothetical protein n=1 Tax=Aureispira sp. CCB-QB1 TaxID=1313421 RepID=UPI000695BA34|nr:hypothetical protein [Aureispira sp. CCB-QB1]
MTTIFYKIDYSSLANEDAILKYSKRDLGEMVFIGDILILNENTKDYLVLKEISLFRFFYQCLHALHELKSTNESKFSDPSNYYDIKMRINKGMLEIKDIDSVQVNYKEFLKEFSIVWKNFIKELELAYPRIINNKKYLELRQSCFDDLP